MWHKKPVTHAFALWIVIGFTAIILIVFLGYSAMLTAVKEGIIQANPARQGSQIRQVPSVFGIVTKVTKDGNILVNSKQSFGTVMVDEVTHVTRVGGGATGSLKLQPGAKIMATGADLGGGILRADALVILENP